MYNITYKDSQGVERKHEGVSETTWRFIRAACDENGWEILGWEKIK